MGLLGGVSAACPLHGLLAKEPEHEAWEENPPGTLLRSLRSLHAPLPWTASLPASPPGSISAL